MFKARNIPIIFKLLSLSLLPIFFIYLLYNFYYIPLYEKNILEDKKEYLQNLMSYKLEYYKLLLSKLNKSDADTNLIKSSAIEYLSTLSLNKNKYFFAFNYQDTTLIVHPLRTELINKKAYNIKDADGNIIYLRFIEELKTKNPAFITYNQKVEHNILPKMSLIYKDTVFKFIIGTGIYIDDVEHKMQILRRKANSLFFILTSLTFLLTYIIAKNITNRIQRILEFAENINNKNFNYQLFDEYNDELGKLSLILNSMVQKLKKSISIIEQEKELALQRNKIKLYLLTSLSENFKLPLLKQLGLLTYDIQILKNSNPILKTTATLINNLFIQIEQISQTLELNELQKYKFQDISLTELFHKLLSKHSSIIATRNIQVSLKIIKERIKLYFDEYLITELIDFILINYINYSFDTKINITLDALKTSEDLKAHIKFELISDNEINYTSLKGIKDLYYQSLIQTPENENLILATELMRKINGNIIVQEQQNIFILEIIIPCYFMI